MMPLRKEYSAGGIVYKKMDGKDYWLLCQHSLHKGWVFPKGLIGDHKEGETHEETAVREVKEETGMDGKIVRKLTKSVGYFYVWKGEKRLKTVYYYLMEFIGGNIEKHDHEMSAVEWLPTEKVLDRLTYKSDKESFKEALIIMSDL